MTSHLTLPTGDFTCSLSSGCGIAVVARLVTSGSSATSKDTSTIRADQTGSAAGAGASSTEPGAWQKYVEETHPIHPVSKWVDPAPTPAPSPVEGEPKMPKQYSAAIFNPEAGVHDYLDVEAFADAWRAHTTSLRSSLAAARAEVERMRVRLELAEKVCDMAVSPYPIDNGEYNEAKWQWIQERNAQRSSPTGEKGAGK